MFRICTFEESVRIPPNLFSLKISDGALKILRDHYERTVHRDYGVIICVTDAKVKGEGRIIQGDGAAYFDTEFEALVYTPKVNEVVEGEVTEIVEFGAFVRIGPIDGLVHVSQIADDFLTYDKKTGALVGKESRKSVKKGDWVRAKVATVSMKDTILNSKIALTMRPAGLGKVAG